MEQTSAEQRAKWVERWRDSGLTAKEFAAETGLKATALYYWSSQLTASAQKDSETRDENAAAVAQPRRARAARPRKRSVRPPRFVELPLAAVTDTPAMLELLLGEVRVRVPPDFDEMTLTRVVRALVAAR